MATIAVEYREGVLKPLSGIEGIKGGEILIIEIKPDLRRLKGVLKEWNISSVDLQHKIKEIWSKNYVSS